MDTVNDNELLRAHQETWHSFTRFLGYAAGAIAAVLVLMALFLL
jgi:Bacterial aa3 type cytochrome c oxidase subunit IV